jgi:pantoate--beta-alanine ligase
MTVVTDIGAWRALRDGQRRRGESLGLVPTMGALHEGHLSLVRRSRGENTHTMVSIFVNPTQFDQQTDLDHYPRTLEADLALLEAEGVGFVLTPSPAQMYPDRYRYKVVEHELSSVLEGAFRPGHFEGVLTVVLKLLNIADAERAYFGEKDWQQLQLVRGMVDALFVRTAIVGCPIVRDPSGLALSSRNQRLSPEDTIRASALNRALRSAETPEEARAQLMADGFTVDYVEDADGRRLAAVRLGGVRLIDNVEIENSYAADAGRR